MKTSTDSIKAEFKPITHTITIESEDELLVLLEVFNERGSISQDLWGSTRQIEVSKIEEILEDAFESLNRHVLT